MQTLLYLISNKSDLLHIACKYGRLDCVLLLVSALEQLGNEEAEHEKLLHSQLHLTNHLDETPLFCAIKGGHLDIVEFLLSKRVSLKQKGPKGKTALMYAAEFGHLTLVDYFLDKGLFSVDEQNERKESALFLAVYEKHYDVLESLVKKHGASLNMKNKWNNTPFIISVVNNNRQAAELFLQHGVDINERGNESKAPILWACLNAHLDMIKYLIERGADVNTRDEYGNSALLVAASRGKLEIMKYLLSSGYSSITETNTSWATPLLRACRGENVSVECVEYLLSQGASLNERDNVGETPFTTAAASGNIEVMKFLLSHGSSLTETNNVGATPLLRACLAGNNSHLCAEARQEMAVQIQHTITLIYWHNLIYFKKKKGTIASVEFLLSQGASLAQRDNSGGGPLIRATRSGNFDLIRLLVDEKGVSIHERDNSGMTPCLYAAQKGCLDIFQYFLSKADDKDALLNEAMDNGSTPLLMAARSGKLHIVEFLVSQGVSLDQHDGHDSLMLAAHFGHIDIVEYILNRREVLEIKEFLSSKAKRIICEVLGNNKTVHSVSFGTLFITVRASLTEMLAKNTHIVSFSLANASPSPTTRRAVLDTIREHNWAITSLDFGEIMDNTQDEMDELMQRNKEWRDKLRTTSVSMLTASRLFFLSSSFVAPAFYMSEDQSTLNLSQLPMEIVELIVLGIGGILSEEERKAILQYGVMRETLGRSKQEFFRECIRSVTYWP